MSTPKYLASCPRVLLALQCRQFWCSQTCSCLQLNGKHEAVRLTCAAPATVIKRHLSVTGCLSNHCAFIAWEGEAIMLASPDTGQDRWKCCERGSSRRDSRTSWLLWLLSSRSLILFLYFFSIQPAGKRAGCCVSTKSNHDFIRFTAHKSGYSAARHCIIRFSCILSVQFGKRLD